ncbi:hypothetical protein C5Y96_10145 [Blastopirellula marina]|uniref:Uncharacterized protein n=1 Tax=Blastopirellula marina TaxID=124 RepID=A0A2S8FM31_9BACT|nr:hypothetical protein C5Y96_10145 [Blastopirellula marina]RCS52296.1 hypothetical protein DTL36_10155 [Bremerella cremea]
MVPATIDQASLVLAAEIVRIVLESRGLGVATATAQVLHVQEVEMAIVPVSIDQARVIVQASPALEEAIRASRVPAKMI